MQSRKILSAVAVLLLIVLLPCLGLGRSCDRASIGADFGLLGDLVFENDIEASIAARVRVSDEFALKLPVTAVFGYESVFLDTGIMLVYYPFGTGPFVSLSLLHFGFETRQRLLGDRIVSLNEVTLGWTWNFTSSWFLEAELTVRDPSGTFEDQYEMIRGAFSGYGTFRLRLLAGWNFLRRPDDGQD